MEITFVRHTEKEATREAIDLYRALRQYFNNYFVVDSSLGEEKVFREVNNILKK